MSEYVCSVYTMEYYSEEGNSDICYNLDELLGYLSKMNQSQKLHTSSQSYGS